VLFIDRGRLTGPKHDVKTACVPSTAAEQTRQSDVVSIAGLARVVTRRPTSVSRRDNPAIAVRSRRSRSL